MAELEDNLRTFLCGQAGVTAIFGATADCRIHVDRNTLPDDPPLFPYAIIRTVQEAPMYAHDGPLPDTGLYQIDVYSDVKTTANSGTAAIKAELSGFSGAMGDITVGHSFATSARGGFDPDARNFRRSIDYEIGQNG